MSSIAEPIVFCPSCSQPVIIAEINCAIFRHGIYKHTGQQIDPHAKKEVCDLLIERGEINGCGKPFRLEMKNGEFVAVVCDYI
jgi:hypothetical protein